MRTSRHSLQSRLLQPEDIPTLLRLERRQWDDTQAASAQALRQRMESHPTLCAGTFCGRTGEALCSFFLKPVSRDKIPKIKRWDDGILDGGSTPKASRSLFGISATSVDPQAFRALEAYLLPRLLRQGWTEIYLGSPMPGLKAALSRDPLLTAQGYAHEKRRHLPRDVQLRYYHGKGFTDIVAVLPGYFPHGDALDYGVLLRGDLRQLVSRVSDQAGLGPWERTVPREASAARAS